MSNTTVAHSRRSVFSADGLAHHRAWPCIVFTTALVLRLTTLISTFPGNGSVHYYDDAIIALNLVAGNGYSITYQFRNYLFYEAILNEGKTTLEAPILTGTRSTAIKQPAYPLLMAALFYSFGP